MNKMRKLAIAVLVLAAAGLSGCATTRTAEPVNAIAEPAAEQQQVSRPTRSYGSLGGYRYRRFVAVNIAAS